MRAPQMPRMEKGFYRNMLTLALPLVLQNLITESLALVDTLMVGALGEGPLAGVTAANIPIFVMTLFIFGVQSGCTVLISQFWGKGDREAVSRVMGVGFYVAGTVSAAFALLLFFAAGPFMSLFGNDGAVAATAAEYGRVVGFSYFFTSLSQVYLAAQRSMGNTRLGLMVLGLSMVANTVFNWIFIFGHLGIPAMGVRGAALGTLLARMLELAVTTLYALCNKTFKLRLRLVLRPGLDTLRRFFRYATPVVLNETFWGLGTALYPTIMGHMAGSKEILAAYGVAGNVEKICTVVIFALAATATILVGQAVGAGERERARRVGRVMDGMSALLGLLTGGLALIPLYTLAPRYLYPALEFSPVTAEITTMMLTVTFVTLAVRAFNTTNIVGVLRGGGDVGAATAIDVGPLWLVALPLAACVGLVWRLGIFWLYMVRTGEEGLKCLLGILRCRSGKWIRDVTVPEEGET